MFKFFTLASHFIPLSVCLWHLLAEPQLLLPNFSNHISPEPHRQSWLYGAFLSDPQLLSGFSNKLFLESHPWLAGDGSLSLSFTEGSLLVCLRVSTSHFLGTPAWELKIGDLLFPASSSFPTMWGLKFSSTWAGRSCFRTYSCHEPVLPGDDPCLRCK